MNELQSRCTSLDLSHILCYIIYIMKNQPKEQTVNTVRPHYLDVTSVTDRDEVIQAYGPVFAWEAAITRLRLKESRARNRRDKLMLRLELLNAENQLQLARGA